MGVISKVTTVVKVLITLLTKSHDPPSTLNPEVTVKHKLSTLKPKLNSKPLLTLKQKTIHPIISQLSVLYLDSILIVVNIMLMTIFMIITQRLYYPLIKEYSLSLIRDPTTT